MFEQVPAVDGSDPKLQTDEKQCSSYDEGLSRQKAMSMMTYLE